MNLSSFARFAPKIGYGDRIRPVRDWFALLAACFLLLIASIAWNAWSFYRVTTGDGFTIEAPAPSTPALDALPEAREVLETRAAEEERYRSFYQFVDPAR